MIGSRGAAPSSNCILPLTIQLQILDVSPRSLFLDFERESAVRGIPTYKFAVPNRFFKAPANDGGNACFCTQPEGLRHPLCSTDGVLDISKCRKGAPILLSAPHFYGGDPVLRINVTGLAPQKAKHETFLEIEPVRTSNFVDVCLCDFET